MPGYSGLNRLTKRYADHQYIHSSVISHKGTVIGFAQNSNRQIFYSVLNLTDDAESPLDVTGWPSDPKPLPFPGEIEQVGYSLVGTTSIPTVKVGTRVEATPGTLRFEEIDPFLSTTARLTADVPFQVFSDNKHLYLFRSAVAGDHSDSVYKLAEGGGASSGDLARPIGEFVQDSNSNRVPIVDSTLLCDRYILAGPELVLTRDVRFRRSRHKTVPATHNDALGAKDMEGNPFFSPTQELAFVNNISGGSFGIAQIPTAVSDLKRWQIFAVNSNTNLLDSFNVEVSKEGLFNLAGTQLYTSPDETYKSAVLERTPGTCPFTDRDLVPLIEEEDYSNTALRFTANNQYARANVSSWTASQYTVEMWAKVVTGTQQAEAFASNFSSSSTVLKLSINNGNWVLHHSGATHTIGLVSDEWQHVAITHDGTTLKCYLDGISATSANTSTTVTFANYVIGSGPGGTASFRGDIDEVRVWNKALLPNKIKHRMNLRLRGDEEGLQAYWAFDEGSGTKALDKTGRTVAATIHSAQWVSSECPMGEGRGVRQATVGFTDRVIDGGISTQLYFQVEQATTGYDGLEKPMKRQARFMIAVGTKPSGSGVSSNSGRVTIVDFAVSRQGRIAKLPAIVNLPHLSVPTQSSDIARVTSLEREVRALSLKIAPLQRQCASYSSVPSEAEIQEMLGRYRRAQEIYQYRLGRYHRGLQTGQRVEFPDYSVVEGAKYLYESAKVSRERYDFLRHNLTMKIRELRHKQGQIADLSGGTLVPVQVAMDEIHLDPSGLSVTGGILDFAYSSDTQTLAITAEGEMALYFRSSEGLLMATYFDVNVSHTKFAFPNDHRKLRLESRNVGALLNTASLEIKNGSSTSTCNLELSETTKNLREVWTDLPRDPQQFADIVNGSLTRNDQVTSTVQPGTLRTSMGSAFLQVIPGSDTTDLINHIFSNPVHGKNGRWTGAAPGRTLNFSASNGMLSSDQGEKAAPTRSFTVEAWVYPNREAETLTRIVHQVSSSSAFSLALEKDTVGRFRLLFAKSAGTSSNHSPQKIARSAEYLEKEKWTNVVVSYQQSYALRFANDKYLECGDTSAFNITGDFTVEAYIQLDNIGQEHGILGKGKMGTRGKGVPYQLRVSSQGYLQFLFETVSGSVETFQSTVTLQAGEFYRVAVSRRTGRSQRESQEPSTFKYKNKAGQEESISVQTVSSVEFDEFADITFYVNQVEKGTGRYKGERPLGNDGLLEVGRCHTSPSHAISSRATVAEVRLWSCALSPSQICKPIAGHETGLVSWWKFEEGKGNATTDPMSSEEGRLQGAEWTRTPDTNASVVDMYVNGVPMMVDILETHSMVSNGWGDNGFFLAGRVKNRTAKECFKGMLEEVRVWNIIRREEQILDNLFTRLRGEMQHLIAYYTFDYDSYDESYVYDVGFRGISMSFPTADDEKPTSMLSQAPLSSETALIRNALSGVETSFHETADSAAAMCEYADMQRDLSGKLGGVLKRCYSYLKHGQWVLVTGHKTGTITTEWIGQAQFEPQVMGFVEGAPPVPSENLTEALGTETSMGSKIDILESESITSSVGVTKEGSCDAGFSAGASYEGGSDDLMLTAPFGFGLAKKMTDLNFGVNLNANFNVAEGWTQEDTMGKSVNKSKTLSVQTAGSFESDNPSHQGNSDIGKRFIPANTGLALVQSSTADIFALRLSHNNALISLRMIPNRDIPIDWNIISFPINPRYTKQGTLDGKIGFDSSGAVVIDESYPNARTAGEYSYYKPREAYSIERRIEHDEQKNLSYYENFGTSYGSTMGKVVGAAAGAAAGLLIPGAGPVIAAGAVGAGINTVAKAFDESKVAKSFSKRDMVNTYVWTADGGFFAEATETSDIRTEVSSGNFSFSGSVGGGFNTDVKIFSIGFNLAFDAAFGGGMSVTKTRSSEVERAFSMEVELDLPRDLQKYSLENGSWNPMFDNAGRPISAPGRVDAYRFKTFYLDSASENFEDLFLKVVDPIWLSTSSHPNAAAMRATHQAEKKPPCWRIFHRVTFVSRVLPEIQDPTAAPLESAMKAQHVESNWQLIQRLEPWVKDKTGSPTLFNTAVRRAVASELPELKPHTSEIIAYLRLYYGI